MRLYHIFLSIFYSFALLLLLPDSGKANPHHRARQAVMHSEQGNWDAALATARQVNNSAFNTLMQWRYLLDKKSDTDFYTIRTFMQKHSDWPGQKALQVRAEFALRNADIDDQSLRRWFSNHPPITGLGKWYYVRTMSPSETEKRKILNEAWINGDFYTTETAAFLASYRHLLNQDTHKARADRQVWEGKYSAAQQTLLLISDKAFARRIKTRIALLTSHRTANSMVARLSGADKKDAGIIYARALWRHRKGLDSGVRELLLQAPAILPYPDKWWRLQSNQIRTLIANRHYTAAYRLATKHGQESGFPLADALWLEGWLALEYIGKPDTAHALFTRMHSNVNFPVSLSRAAYWAGRAAEKAGKSSLADKWYRFAATHTTTFYGQLAVAKLSPTQPLYIPDTPDLSAYELQQYAQKSIPQAVHWALQMDKPAWAYQLLNHLVADAQTEEDITKAVYLGKQLNRPYIHVHTAKQALQKQLVYPALSYPILPQSENLPVESALTHAIIRQESLFNAAARSSANARGMMQLLPGTARQMAKDIGYVYDAGRLNDPTYNVRLGTEYLSQMIERFDGSYIQAIASYNAGPGNVIKWRQRFGPPPRNVEGAINWIEHIPFSETRNYVQRVIENAQIYRQMLTPRPTPLLIQQDLTR